MFLCCILLFPFTLSGVSYVNNAYSTFKNMVDRAKVMVVLKEQAKKERKQWDALNLQRQKATGPQLANLNNQLNAKRDEVARIVGDIKKKRKELKAFLQVKKVDELKVIKQMIKEVYRPIRKVLPATPKVAPIPAQGVQPALAPRPAPVPVAPQPAPVPVVPSSAPGVRPPPIPVAPQYPPVPIPVAPQPVPVPVAPQPPPVPSTIVMPQVPSR